MRLTPRQREALELIADGRMYPTFVREEDGWHARWRALGGDNPWVDTFVREAAITPLSRNAEDQRHETLHDAWLVALRSETGLVRWDDAECESFAAEIAEWNGAADDGESARRSLVFRFEAKGEGDFSITCEIPKGRRALRALGQATYVFGPLRAMSGRGGLLSVALSRAEAESFLRRGARELALAGYGVEGVDLSALIEAEVELESQESAAAGSEVPARLVVHVDGEAVSAEEIRFLLEQKSTLVFFRDRWIEVDRNILRMALRAFRLKLRRLALANTASLRSLPRKLARPTSVPARWSRRFGSGTNTDVPIRILTGRCTARPYSNSSCRRNSRSTSLRITRSAISTRSGRALQFFRSSVSRRLSTEWSPPTCQRPHTATIRTGAVPPASIRVVRGMNTSRPALTTRNSAQST